MLQLRWLTITATRAIAPGVTWRMPHFPASDLDLCGFDPGDIEPGPNKIERSIYKKMQIEKE